MSSSDEKKAGFGNPIVNLILTGLVFLFFTWILRAYVPAKTVWLNWLFSAFAATTLTMTFYFAINMFQVTLRDHKNREG
ncbi:MAG: hypothetical protein P8L44_20935 [Opitutales bacterium]|jgi:hypothetical protein|nr:hypothetical protein [Opitutales bacterium]